MARVGSAQISAHRFACRAPRGEVRARSQQLQGVADFVEIDLQLLGDGMVVLWHDTHVEGHDLLELTAEQFERLAPEVPGWDELLAALPDDIGLHLDLKFVAAGADQAPERPEIAIVRQAIAAVGTDRILVTSLEDDSVAVVARWAASHAPRLRVGLTLGRGFTGLRLRGVPGLLRAELFPARRLRESGATAIAVHHRLARLRVARVARRTGLPMAVWTVDSPRALRYWGARAWLVVTNDARLARRVIRPRDR